MRRQWPCSKCGFACSSTWRSLYPPKPVVCNTCMSKQKDIIVALNNNPPHMLRNTSSLDDHDQISSSPTSIMQRNMSNFTVSQIGTIFGKLPFEPLPIPVNVLGCGNESSTHDPELKTKAVREQKPCDEFGFHDHFYSGSTSLRTSTGPGFDNCQETLLGARSFSVWDPNKVRRKRRSKLHQYTLSPLARLLRQLHRVYRSNITLDRAAYGHRGPKYDDALIYEKCKYVCENEIGLGAKLLFQRPIIHFSRNVGFCKGVNTYAYSTTTTSSSSASESGAYSNCLIDVPIRSSL